MDVLDIQLDEKLSEKLKVLIPYLYTDTLKLLLILELLNIFLTFYNLFVLFGLGVSKKTRTILANNLAIEIITKIAHLASIYLIWDRETVTFKAAVIFLIIFTVNFTFYFLNKLICHAVLLNDRIMNSEGLSNWKVVLWIYFALFSPMFLGVLVFVYEPSLASAYASVLIIAVLIVSLYIFVNLVRKEFKNLRKSKQMSEGEKVRLNLLRIMIYIPIIVCGLCLATIKMRNILDVSPVVMFLYFIYLRRVARSKLSADVKKTDGDKVKAGGKGSKSNDTKKDATKSSKNTKKVSSKKDN